MTNHSVAGLIFSNMHEKLIPDLTAFRSCGSVPFGGRYRLIDFVISNMVAGGISTVGVVTKSNYKSLMDHIGTGRDWDLARKRGGLVLLPPYASAGTGLYHGRMEAMISARDFVSHSGCDWGVMADCNYIFNADVQDIVSEHIASGADITVVAKNMRLAGSMLFDSVTYATDSDGRVTEVRLEPIEDGQYLCGLNMFVVSKSFMLRLIEQTQGRGVFHFERDILQARCRDLKIHAYITDAQVLRIGSMKEYYSANMALLQPAVRHELFDVHPVYTKVRDEMPVRYGLFAKVSNSLIADGCLIEGSVEDSVLFRSVSVGRGAKIKNCILMQGCTVEDGADIEGVVADKDTVITAGRRLAGCAENPLFIPKGGVV